jgi:hypothetical protein
MPPVEQNPHVIVELDRGQVKVGSNLPNPFMMAGLLVYALVGLVLQQGKEPSRIITP